MIRPEHHHLALRHESQRLEPAGPIGVILEQPAIHVERAKDLLRNRLVPALSVPGAAAVSAADCEATMIVLAVNAFEHGIITDEVLGQRLVGVHADRSPLLRAGPPECNQDNEGYRAECM